MNMQLTEREAIELSGVCSLARLGGKILKVGNCEDKGYCSFIDSLIQVAKSLEKQLGIEMEKEGETHG